MTMTAAHHRTASLVFRHSSSTSSSSCSPPDLSAIRGLDIPREVAVPLTPCENSVLLPFVVRHEEMRSLVQHNGRFFGMVRKNIGDKAYRKLLHLWRQPRERVPDLDWIHETRQILGEGLFCEWARVVGLEDGVKETLESPKAGSHVPAIPEERAI